MKLYSFRPTKRNRPDWTPLTAIAKRSAARADVPTIAADDFMWMCEMESVDAGAPLHSYKHIDTRRYLNVDADLRLFAYVDDLDDEAFSVPLSELVVHYRRLGGLAWAIERLDLGWRRFHDDVIGVLDDATGDSRSWPANVTPLIRYRRGGGSVA